LGKYSKVLKYAAASKALKHSGKVKMPAKKTILIIVGVISFIGLLILAGFIALVIWLIGLINPNTVTETANNVQSVAQEVLPQVNPQAFIEPNGQVDTQALEEQISALPPAQVALWVEAFRTQINQLLEQGQILQSQAELLLNVLP
jgi:hypothetical protein